MSIDSRAAAVLPGLATAFDEEAMKSLLQAALFGGDYVVERCRPARPLYMPGPSCLLRYRVRASSRATGAVLEPIVTGRVFPEQAACAAYLRSKLAPVAERMLGRPETAAFAAPAAAIEPLHMVVYVWPVDGELPALVDATDPLRMADVFRETLGRAVERCDVELVSYRRRQRCVLRYTVVGEGRRLVAYGKVSGVGNETPKDAVVEELGRRLAGSGLAVPRSLGWRPELELSLLEALPGEALIGPALRGDPTPGALSLEEMIATCGHAAAALHGSGATLGLRRTIDDELAGLQRDVALVRPFVPTDREQAWFEQVAALAGQSQPLPLCLCHGDFKYEQLLFDGARSALVDFDGVCQAEPALDLGKFLAHLRVAAPAADELAAEFLRAYIGATGERLEDERHLRARTALYEAVSLLHLTLWSRRNLDESAARVASTLLEERLSA
jgi:Ser/Thr protein kinase RdoA (MazF antagonist)